MVGAITFPPYTLSPTAASPCYGSCPAYTRASFLKTGVNSGFFPEELFAYKEYTDPDQLVSDIQAYKVHLAFPVNSVVSQLRNSKGIVLLKLSSASTAVLWRPARVFQPASLIIEAFAPVVGLFAVVFIGCLLSGVVTVIIELHNPSSMFFVESPGHKRTQEVRDGKPLARGFWFALNSTFSSVMSACIAFDTPAEFRNDFIQRLLASAGATFRPWASCLKRSAPSWLCAD